MAWLSRLPKRRVVSGLDLDEEDLPATSASGLCPKRDSRPSAASEPPAVVRQRHRRRVIEEETVVEPARSRALPAAVPPSEGPLPEESPERPATRQSPRVESAPRRRRNSFSELSISEESGGLTFPDRPTALEPTMEAVGTRRRLRQSISEESLIFAERPAALEPTAETGILPTAVPASEGLLPEESPERPATRQSPRVESAPRRRRNSFSELSISEDQPSASRNPDAAAPTPCRRRWTRRVKRRQAAREPPEEAERLIDVITLSERPQEDESISQEPSSSWRSAAETIEIPDTQPDPHELHEISESEDWSPARLGRAVRLSPPFPVPPPGMVWPFAPALPPLQQNMNLAAARAAAAHMQALVPGNEWAVAQLMQMQDMNYLRRESERLLDELNTLTRNIMARQAEAFPDAIPELPRLGNGREVEAQMRRRLEGREFTADDYETLLQLDAPTASRRDAVEIQSLISVLPSSKLPAGAASRDCMVCMDQMQPGQEVKTLPCMHVFHVECIDRWLRESRNRPRCPIDQEDVRLD